MLFSCNESFGRSILTTAKRGGGKRFHFPIVLFVPFIFQLFLLLNRKYMFPSVSGKNFQRTKVSLNSHIYERKRCKRIHFIRDHFIFVYLINHKNFSYYVQKNVKDDDILLRQVQARGFINNNLGEDSDARLRNNCYQISRYFLLFLSLTEKKAKVNDTFQSSYNYSIVSLSDKIIKNSRNYISVPGGKVINGTFVISKNEFIKISPYDKFGFLSFPQRNAMEVEGSIYAPDYLNKVDISNGLFVGSSSNWYHFMVEIFPRIVQFADSTKNIPIILPKSTPHQIVELCRMASGTEPIQIADGEVACFESLTVCLDGVHSKQVDIYESETRNIFENRREDLRMILDWVNKHYPHRNESDLEMPGRYFFARKEGSSRNLNNRSEICRAVEVFGFRTVFLDDLKFSDQLGILRSANFIVAEPGASLTGMLFASPECRILRLEPPEEKHM